MKPRMTELTPPVKNDNKGDTSESISSKQFELVWLPSHLQNTFYPSVNTHKIACTGNTQHASTLLLYIHICVCTQVHKVYALVLHAHTTHTAHTMHARLSKIDLHISSSFSSRLGLKQSSLA